MFIQCNSPIVSLTSKVSPNYQKKKKKNVQQITIDKCCAETYLASQSHSWQLGRALLASLVVVTQPKLVGWLVGWSWVAYWLSLSLMVFFFFFFHLRKN
jgi:hypothetical protein